MTKKYPSQEMDRFNVRMPTGMRDEITKIAEKNGRSMNTEIIMMLQDGIDNARNHLPFPFENASDDPSESHVIRMKSAKKEGKEYFFSIKNEDVEKAYKEAIYSLLLKDVLLKNDDEGEFDEIRNKLIKGLEEREKEKNSKFIKEFTDEIDSKNKKAP
ncbi:Arc family DNA-binding protein [Xenorhabdus bovienii]|uniref:Arc family DNA-binding protein n=1 Tax=Xenorhabdus bovienii TaxID=40576 RepID=UPI0023B2B623|nr:Arc family DNA-binding protein [Xenorhabdus bovienii]MDE9557662.1 Arc family DNA-binding protein [Xenorhabdus bovienii]